MPTVSLGGSAGGGGDPIEATLRASLGSVGNVSGCGDTLEDRIASSAKKVLLTKIEYVPAEKEYAATLTSLQTKYTHLKLNSSGDNDVITSKDDKHVVPTGNGSCDDRPWSSESGDGIPKPRVVIHPSDNVKLGWTRVYKIGAGLANLGNTCFLNATLQCLTYTPPLVNHLIEYNEHSSSCKNVGFCMMCELQRHIRRALDKNGEIIRPQCILQKLRSIAAHMSWGRQEDAHEFLRYVMESMVSASLNGFSNTKLDRISFETTVVNQIFGGYHRSQVICLRCKECSDTYDHFMDLMLDIKNVQSLEKAMENFVQPEVLDSENAYMCPKCKQKCPAKKRFTIHRAPNIATFQLKRFDYSRSLGGKITKHISFPEKFDMRSCMSQRQGLPIMYLLYAVLVHQGPSCNSGHYFCFVRNSNNLWYLMDDGKVRQVSLSVVLNQQAYLLFYTRIPNNGQLLKSPLQQSLSNNRLLHLSNPSSLNNGVAGNPVNESFGIALMRKPGIFPSNLLKPKTGLTSLTATQNTANVAKTFTSSTATSTSLSSSSSTISTSNSLPTHREKITFDFKSNNGSGSASSSNNPAQNSSVKSTPSTSSATEPQKHPRIVMHIKNGKVYSYQQEWTSGSNLGSRTALTNISSSSSRLGSSLVPYAPDSSEDSSDQDTTVRLNNGSVAPEVASENDVKKLSNRGTDSQLTVMVGSQGGVSKVNATSQQWVVVDSSQQSPSVASEGSNNSVNSTTGWTVTDNEKDQSNPSNAKGDRRCNRWTVVSSGSVDGTQIIQPVVNGIKKQTSRKSLSETRLNAAGTSVTVSELVTDDSRPIGNGVSPLGESDDLNARLSEVCDDDAPRCSQKNNAHSGDGDDDGGDGEPMPSLMNGHGSGSRNCVDDQATRRHKKRKKSKREREDSGTDECNSKKKSKHKAEVDSPSTVPSDEMSLSSKRKRKRSTSGTSSSSSSGGGSSAGYELEWVEKTKETLDEKKDDPCRTESTSNKTSSNEDCSRDKESLTTTTALTNGDVVKRRPTVTAGVQSNGTVVDELLKNSSRGYGSAVCSWNGERSAVDRDVERDNHIKRFERCADGYDEEYDRGRTKKVKKPFGQIYRNAGSSNPFQHAYEAKASGNFYQRPLQHQPYQWIPQSSSSSYPNQSHWGDSRRGPRRGNHTFYHHDGNRARHSFHHKHY